MTRIKICGIRSPEIANQASECGIDAIGLVFYGGSIRAVSADLGAEIVAAVPPLVSVVGLFVDASQSEIEDVLSKCPVDILQFHGCESAAFCTQFDRPYIKAVGVQPGLDLEHIAREHTASRALLLDAWADGRSGGTGQTFDWGLIPEGFSRHWVLAGGLNPQNVAEAIRQTSAPAVDVSGGVESAPGEKDIELIQRFVAEVQSTARG
ncbi:MAG: phosphoribosylanthranilate isomerase [Pseudomonadota bacterium]